MGALGGHMAHLHESLELTFDELSTILDSVANADISATEKVDGQNLFLTVKSDGSINTARNGGDLKKGGMTPNEFAAKWKGHPAESAFTKGFEAISQAIKSLDQSTLNDLFANGTRYVNMEVMYPGNPNMIVYDAGNVVLHNFQTFDSSGAPVDDPDARTAFQQLVSAVDEAESDVDGEAWLVKGPVIAQLQRLADGTALKEVQAAIQRIASPVGMSATLGDLAELRLRATAIQAGIPENKVDQMMDAAFEREGAASVRDIKKGLTKEQQGVVSKLATKANARKAVGAAMKPLELAITDFAIEVLRGMESYFVSDTDKELARQRNELSRAIDYLEGLATSGDEEVGKMVDRQLEKLTDIENQINSTMEGIVFEYPPGSGELKKLTGSFAMMNQLVGRAKRAGMPSGSAVEESYGRAAFSSSESASIYDLILNEQAFVDKGKRVGLIPVSGKPYHAGHHYLVEQAAADNDEVVLFVSTSDRKRKGEMSILGVDMLQVWEQELEKIMPTNVRVEYGGSPVRKVYDTIGKACEAGDAEETYVIYSDPTDTMQNYPQVNRDKYMQPMCRMGQVVFAAEEDPTRFERGEGSPDVSGTKMRAAMAAGDFETFAAGMPAGVNSRNVWSILTHDEPSPTSESKKYSLVSALYGS
jgi:phosphopantetheine adenylyltransferase